MAQIVMENRSFLEFMDELFGRDELPVWKEVAECVAALAAFHHLNRLKVSGRGRLASTFFIFLFPSPYTGIPDIRLVSLDLFPLA